VTSERRGVLQVFAVANLVLCACLLFVSLPFFWQQIKVLKFWAVTEAQVLRNEIAVEPGPEHEQIYAARLGIVYTVDGRPVTAELTSYESKNYRATAERAAGFPVGSRHEIRYNPNDVTQARMGAGWNRRFFAVPLVVAGVGMLFAVFAVGLLLAARGA
jgi:hypothetical protein